MEYTYLDRTGVEITSCTIELMEGLWEAGEIDGLTQIKVGDEWKVIAEIPELKGRFAVLGDSENLEDEDEDEDEEETGSVVKTASASAAVGTFQEKTYVPRHALSWEEQWQSTKTEEGQTYFCNVLSMETAWQIEKPSALPPGKLPPLWQALYRADGSIYYFHTVHKQSQLEFPGELKEKEGGDAAAESVVGKRKVPEDKAEEEKPPAKVLTAEEIEKKEKKKKKKANNAKWKKKQKEEKSYVYVDKLPLDATLDEIVGFFSKCGKIKVNLLTDEPMVKMYRGEDGGFKGDCKVGFLKEGSVSNAISLLDGADFRQGHPIRVSPAVFQKKEGFVKETNGMDKKEQAKLQRILKLKQQKEERGLSWAEGQIDDGRHIRIVIVKPMFDYLELKANPDLKIELEADVRRECSKFGHVEKVSIFDTNPEGVVAIRFKLVDDAEKCIATLHERYFDKRQLTAEFWDGVTNHKGEVHKETEEEEARRLKAYGDFLEGKASEE